MDVRMPTMDGLTATARLTERSGAAAAPGPPPRVVVQCHDYHILLTLVASSDLFCLVPHPCLLKTIEPGSVRAIRLREGLPKYEVNLSWLRDVDERFQPVIQAIASSLSPIKDPG